MSGHIVVRDAHEGDADAVAALWADVWDGPVPFPVPFPAHAAVSVLVAEKASRVIGMAWLSEVPTFPHGPVGALRVDYLVVARSARSRGVGRALMAAAAAEAERRGLERLRVAAGAERRGTDRFLARLGMHRVLTERAAAPVTVSRRLAGDPATLRTRSLVARRRADRARGVVTDS